jgi:hypothetical protein
LGAKINDKKKINNKTAQITVPVVLDPSTSILTPLTEPLVGNTCTVAICIGTLKDCKGAPVFYETTTEGDVNSTLKTGLTKLVVKLSQRFRYPFESIVKLYPTPLFIKSAKSVCNNLLVLFNFTFKYFNRLIRSIITA